MPALTCLETHTIVVASPDATVRVQCVMQLVRRGCDVITSNDFKSPGIGDRVRRTAIIAVAEGLLPPDASQWRDIIEDHGWTGRVLVLGGAASAIDRSAVDLTYLPAPFDVERFIAEL